MSKAGKSRLIRTAVLAVLGIAVLAIFLAFFADIEGLQKAILSVDPLWYTAAFISVTVGVVFYTLSWTVILRAAGIRLGFKDALSFIWVSVFFNLLIPTGSVSGEAARAYLTVRRSESDTALVLATIMSHRVITLIPFIVGSSVGLFHLAYEYNVSGAVLDALILVVAVFNLAFLVTLYLVVKPEKTMSLAGLTVRLARLISRRRFGGEGFRNRVYGWFDEFKNGLKFIRDRPKALIASTFAAFLFWICDVMVAFLTFRALGVTVPLPIVITVYTIGITLQMIPIGIPGMVGPVEVAMITLYSNAGVNETISTAATILIRLVMLWYMMAVGAAVTYGSKASREEIQKALSAS